MTSLLAAGVVESPVRGGRWQTRQPQELVGASWCEFSSRPPQFSSWVSPNREDTHGPRATARLRAMAPDPERVSQVRLSFEKTEARPGGRKT